jgi:hypothetical protein
MMDRFLQQVAVPLAAAVSRFEREAGVVFQRVDGLTGVAPTLQVGSEPVEQPAELSFVVERGDDLVAAFVTLRIVRIPAHYIALNSVIFRVHGRHPTIVRPGTTLPTDSHSGRPGFSLGLPGS